MLFIIVTLIIIPCYGCNSENKASDINCATCEDKEIIKELKNELAIVRKDCFEHVGRVDTFYFELTTLYEGLNNISIMPCNVIPKEYRIDGLSVTISGKITNCLVLGGCSEPNIKLASFNIFELISIKNIEK